MVSKTLVERASMPIIEWASYGLAALGLWLVLYLHLLPALLAGLLVNQLVHSITPLLGQRISSERARIVVVTALGVLVVTLLMLLVLGVMDFFRHELGNITELWQRKLMPLMERAREQLPLALTSRLPGTLDDLRAATFELMRRHAETLQLAGKGVARGFLLVMIGLLLGALVALSQARPVLQRRPLTASLSRRCRRLARAFHRIVFAQIKISLLNTGFTALFLLGILPLLGVHMPFAKTLVMVTFVAGLLPVLGNLLSNTIITIAGLSVSLWVGVMALAFLIVIHKLEYFLNARIVGIQIRARAWELLLAMLVMEAAFGLAGLIAAPIYYAYLKNELEVAGLV